MRVLVVEDEDLLAEFLKRSLTKAGHDVDYAPNGEIAFHKITTRVYDVVVLDIIIPYKNGLEVCREARELGIKTPIIILSSQDAEASRIDGLDAGADDYMIKPFSYPELEARLRALNRRPKEIIDDVIEIDGVTFDGTNRKITFQGNVLDLRSKAYRLVEYMMRNAGRVMTREEIFENVWGVSAVNASNRVDVCVAEVRAKINKDFIRTVHGLGYTVGKSGDEQIKFE